MLDRICKIRIIVPTTFLQPVIDILHALGVLHLKEVQAEKLSSTLLAEDTESLSDLLLKLKSARNFYKIGDNTQDSPKSVPNLIVAHRIILDATNLENAKQLLIQRISKLKQDIKSTRILSLMRLGKEDFEPMDSVVSYFGQISEPIDKKELKKAAKSYKIYSHTEQKKEYVAIFAPVGVKSNIESLLSKKGFETLSFHFGGDLTELESSLKKAEDELETLQKDILEQRGSDADPICQIISYLECEIEKREVVRNFRSTQSTSIIEGFIPEKEFSSIKSNINKIVKNALIVKKVKITDADKVPTKLDNKEPVASMKTLLDLYSLPSYRELDPSKLFFITFPLLFGFMLGDFGYGILCAGIFHALKLKFKKIAPFLNILFYSSIGSILFGLVFGEFFGYELYHPLISRNPAHSIDTLLYTSVAFGILHINIGLIFGIINESRLHGLGAAMLKKGGWIALELTALVFALHYMGIWTIGAWFPYVVMVLALIVLYKGEHVHGLVEIPTFFGNMLSYARLMAIGLSSVGLALIINDFAQGFFDMGSFYLLIGALILVLGHLVNMAIGLFDSFLQSLRLHYVELFSKFYIGGGIPYKPFGKKQGGK